jgi:hypothetical protein
VIVGRNCFLPRIAGQGYAVILVNGIDDQAASALGVRHRRITKSKGQQ